MDTSTSDGAVLAVLGSVLLIIWQAIRAFMAARGGQKLADKVGHMVSKALADTDEIKPHAPKDDTVTVTQLSDALTAMTAVMEVTTSINRELQTARAEITLAKSAREAAEVEMRKQLADMAARITQIEAERNKLRAELADLRTVLKARDEIEAKAAEARIAELEAQLKKLERLLKSKLNLSTEELRKLAAGNDTQEAA